MNYSLDNIHEHFKQLNQSENAVFFFIQLIGIISGGRSGTMANTRTLETNVEEAVPLMKSTSIAVFDVVDGNRK
jgi:hypothetical protein